MFSEGSVSPEGASPHDELDKGKEEVLTDDASAPRAADLLLTLIFLCNIQSSYTLVLQQENRS